MHEKQGPILHSAILPSIMPIQYRPLLVTILKTAKSSTGHISSCSNYHRCSFLKGFNKARTWLNLKQEQKMLLPCEGTLTSKEFLLFIAPELVHCDVLIVYGTKTTDSANIICHKKIRQKWMFNAKLYLLKLNFGLLKCLDASVFTDYFIGRCYGIVYKKYFYTKMLNEYEVIFFFNKIKSMFQKAFKVVFVECKLWQIGT